jgi:hypothetical protein
VIPTYEITPDLADELHAAVRWWQRNGRPDLTAPQALAEAAEDWIAALRAEHLAGHDIPRDPPPLRRLSNEETAPQS